MKTPSAARSAPAPASPAGPLQGGSLQERVLALQRTAGNRAVTALVQAKLTVGASDDPYEREADRVAAQVLRGVAVPPRGNLAGTVRRAPVSHVKDTAGGLPVDERFQRTLDAQRGGGTGLPAHIRNKMEPRFGADFGRVRIHNGPRADTLNRSIQARAFTAGADIYFRQGAYSPATSGGQELLAHELTHVVQQGGAAASGSHAPVGQVAQRSLIQRSIFDDLKNLFKGKQSMGDQDVKSITPGEGGTANRVDRVKYKYGIGGSGMKKGFFKPNVDAPNMGTRAVASSQLDKALGFNILAEEVHAAHNGQQGSVSAQVKGNALFENEFNAVAEQQDPNAYLDFTGVKKKDGVFYKKTGTRFANLDFTNPQTQKGMARLQLLDAITGQADRHGGNIYVDPKTGKVKGIDNDLAFGRKGQGMGTNVANAQGKYHGLPAQVDEKTANKVLKMDPEKLTRILTVQHGAQLRADEIEDTKRRLREVQEHVRQLKAQGKLVKKWDNSTYVKAMQEQNKISWRGGILEGNYLKRGAAQAASPDAGRGRNGRNDRNDRTEYDDNHPDMVNWVDNAVFAN